MSRIDFYCLLFAVLGAGLLYWGKRREFLRINALGVETFPSYGSKLLSKLADGTLVGTGIGFLGASIVTMIIEYAGEWLGLALFIYILHSVGGWYEKRR